MGRPKGSKNRTRKGSSKITSTEPISVKLSTTVIDIPAGKCPLPLEGDDSLSVSVWARNIINWGRSLGRNYSASALIYWVRHTYEIGSKEYNRCVDTLGELFNIDKKINSGPCSHEYGGYFLPEHDNFYCYICHSGMGLQYYKDHKKE